MTRVLQGLLRAVGQHGSPRPRMTGGAGSTLCWEGEPPTVAPTTPRGPDHRHRLRRGTGIRPPRTRAAPAARSRSHPRHRPPSAGPSRRRCPAPGPHAAASWWSRSSPPSARSPTRPPRPAALAAAGQLQQLAYRVLGTRPAWDRKVLRGRARAAGAGGDRERRVAPRVPVHAHHAQPHAARPGGSSGLHPRVTCCATTGRPSASSASAGSTSPRSTSSRPAWAGSGAPRWPARRGRCSSSRPPGRAGGGATSTHRATRSWPPPATWRPTASPAAAAARRPMALQQPPGVRARA